MNDELLADLALIVGVGSMVACIVLFFLIITLFFRKTQEVERRIATPGKALEEVRMVWGNGPIGRWLRVIYVNAFFGYRNIPRFGKRIAARMGDENEPVPLSLKLWVIVPFILFYVTAFLFFFSGWYLGALD